jgi:surface-anchored protein
MKKSKLRLTGLLTLVAVSLPGSLAADERELWNTGHGDVQINYAAGAWDYKARIDSEPENVNIGLGPIGRMTIPSNPDFNFLGAAGDPVWVIPQTETAGIPFVGFSSEGTVQGTFVNDRFDVFVPSVTGPGNLFMWTTGAGSVDVDVNSANGLDASDFLSFPAPGHFHNNIGFSAPGTYLVGLRPQGNLAAGGTTMGPEKPYRFQVNVFDHGEIDIEVVYESGAWEIALLDEANMAEHESDEAALHAGPATWSKVPTDPAFSFLGSPGDTIFVLPQAEDPNLLFLGIAGDEIPTGVFQNETVNLNLAAVQGPGDVFLYSTDAFGAPTKYFDSADGITGSDTFPIAVGGHSHQNWAFSAPGYYRVSVNASGTLVAGSQASASSTVDLLFEVFAPEVFSQGEVDLEVAYEAGEWELVLLDEPTMREICANEAILQAVPATLSCVPSDPQFGFLGASGAPLYVLPQDEREGILFLGIAGDEIPGGVFQNDSVSLNLDSVNGPGNVFLYSTDAFGAPTKYFDTSDGLSTTDVFPVAVGGHSHQSWAFTAPGVYTLGLKASANLAANGSSSSSAVVSFTFEILPREVFSAGELDLEVAYEAGEFEIALLDETAMREVETHNAILAAAPAALEPVPNDPNFAFLGSPGQGIHILPQNEIGGILFLGIAGDELPMGEFTGDSVQLHLTRVNGPGNVFLYNVDGFGMPTVFFNSSDGIDVSDAFPVTVGGHSHQNWGFSQSGKYEVTLQVAATKVAGSQGVMSDPVTVVFDVRTPEVFARGELDVEVVYEMGEWEIALLDESTEREIEPADGLLKAAHNSERMIPGDAAFSFLGTPGDPIFVLPQAENPSLLFLGIAGDEIPGGVFTGDSVNLDLIGVRGPGHVFLYSEDAFGMPNAPFFNSADGVDASDAFPVAVGGHSHQNWAFTAPGIYKVAVQAAGTLTAGSQMTSSPVVELSFLVEAREIFSAGELDLEVAFDNGEFEIALLDEVGMREIEPNMAVLRANAGSLEPVPNDPAFGFLGHPGDRIYVLPQNEQAGLLFLGIAGDEIPGATFQGDAVDLELLNVHGPGPVYLYAVDGFGAPTEYFNSANGIDENDAFPVMVGGHSHQNWGFGAAGTYEVTVRARGTLSAGSQPIASAPVTLLFDVRTPEVFNAGELDLEVAFDGAFEIALLDEGAMREVEPGDALLQGLPPVKTPVPPGSEFTFLGAEGDPVWILPQAEQEGLLFLGIAGDEISGGTFQGDSVNLKLVGVRGPGNVFLYSEDGFGTPNAPFFDTADGIDGNDVFPVAVGGHSHQNWGFTAPGVYKVAVQAEGVAVAGGQTITSPVAEFTFEVLDFLAGVRQSAMPNTLSIGWQSVFNRLYQIQTSTTIPPVWMDHGAPIIGTGGPMDIDIAISGLSGFYRIVDQGPLPSAE